MKKLILFLLSLGWIHFQSFSNIPTLNYPNGGECFIANESVVISWNNAGNMSSSLSYTTDNENIWIPIWTGYFWENTYVWTVPPNLCSSICKIKVADGMNPGQFDVSANWFSIVSGYVSTPSLNSPGYNELFCAYPIGFSCSGGGTCPKYHIQVSSNSNFTPPYILEDYTYPNNIIYLSSGLSPGTYYWRARAENCKTPSGSSWATSSFQFGTLPGAPIANPPTYTAMSANFSWAAGSPVGTSPLTYYWAVGTTNTVTYESGYTDRGFTTGFTSSTTILAPNQTYYFTVKACNNCPTTCSNYSTCQQFTTLSLCTTPGIPIGITINGITSTGGNFFWSIGTPAGSPIVSYYWAVGPTSSVTYESGYTVRGITTQLSVLTNSLSPGSSYYFRLKACTGCDLSCSNYSVAQQFNTLLSCSTPGTPISNSPENITPTGATFSWIAGSPPGSPTITYYWAVGLSSDVTYESGWIDHGMTTGTFSVTNILNPSTLYYFRVKAGTNCDNTCSNYSTYQQFTTITPNQLPIINILYPTEGQTFTTRLVTINGTALDPDGSISLVQVSLNGTLWYDANGTETWFKELALLQGPNTIYAKAKDSFSVWSNITTVHVVNNEPECLLTNLKLHDWPDYLYAPNISNYNGDPLYHNFEYIIPYNPFLSHSVNAYLEPPPNAITCHFCGELQNRFMKDGNTVILPLKSFNFYDITSSTIKEIGPINTNSFLPYGEVYVDGLETHKFTLEKNLVQGSLLSICTDDLIANPTQSAVVDCIETYLVNKINFPFLSYADDARSTICDYKDIFNNPSDPILTKLRKVIMLTLDIVKHFASAVKYLCPASGPAAAQCYGFFQAVESGVEILNCTSDVIASLVSFGDASYNYDLNAKEYIYSITDTENIGQTIANILFYNSASYGGAAVSVIDSEFVDSICPIETSVKFHSDSLFFCTDSLNTSIFPGCMRKYAGYNVILTTADDSTLYHFTWSNIDSIRIRISENFDTLHIVSQFTLNFTPSTYTHAWYNFADTIPLLHLDLDNNSSEDTIIHPDVTPPPIVISPVGYCQYSQASPLIATGAELLWYAAPTGGTGSTIPPIPNTQTTGITNYYVSQTLNTLEGPRACITVFVNQLPIPLITGDSNVCLGESGVVYATDSGMSNYTWAVDGGVITSRDTVNSIQVTWTSLGDHFVSVNYTDSNGCRALLPMTYEVRVHPLPNITINGPTPICSGSANNTYTTQNGMSNYTWSISPGGSIIAGGGATNNFISITWNYPGQQYVKVNYTDSNGCSALNPKQFDVTVNPLPVISITGPNSVCKGSSGNKYSTRTGMSNYIWNVSSGGTITAGGTPTSNFITIKWIVADTQVVSINYTDPNGCTAAAPTVYPVIVHPLPEPTISGPSDLCLNIVGTYTTELGMSNYIWTYAPGGIKIGGGSTSSSFIKLKWPSTGQKWVKVTYKNSYGCQAPIPTNYPVTVRPLPNPSIAGPNKVCEGTTGVRYKTQSGKTNYIWSISAGGIITAGGSCTSDSLIVTWNAPGAQWVSVNYSDMYECTALTPKKYSVTVIPATKPTIYGAPSICKHDSALYTTEGGKFYYSWTVSPGGTFISPLGKYFIWIHWDSAGTQTVSVNYYTPNGCPVLYPTTKTVQVRPIPVPSLTGPTTVCINTKYMYSTDPGMKNYDWSISPSGQIISGFHSYQVFVNWLLPAAQWLKVYYVTPYYCRPIVPTRLDVTAVTCASNLVPGTGMNEIDIVPSLDESQILTHIFTQDGSELSFGLFPNPTEGRFTLQIVTSQSQILNLSIFNIEGREIFWVPQIHATGKFDLVIDLTGFPSGIYAVILKNNDQQVLKKLILRK